MSLLDNLPHQVTISRMSYASDSYGRIESLRPLASGVSAWVQNATQSDIVESQKRKQIVTHRIAFSGVPSVRMRPGDYVTVTSGPSFVGSQFKFLSATDRSAGLGVLWIGLFEENTQDDPPEDDS